MVGKIQVLGKNQKRKAPATPQERNFSPEDNFEEPIPLPLGLTLDLEEMTKIINYANQQFIFFQPSNNQNSTGKVFLRSPKPGE